MMKKFSFCITVVFSLLVLSTMAEAECIGNTYTDQLEEPLPLPTSIEIQSSTKILSEGEVVRLSVPDLEPNQVLRWCTPRGEFTQASQDFSEVEWKAPLIPENSEIIIQAHMLSNDGSSASAFINISVLEGNNFDPSDPPPTLNLIAQNIANKGERTFIELEAIDFDSSGVDTTDSLYLLLAVESPSGRRELLERGLVQETGLVRGWIAKESGLHQISAYITDGNSSIEIPKQIQVEPTDLGQIIGLIVRDRQGVAGVPILVNGTEKTLSSFDGSFQILQLPTGQYLVEPGRPGYRPSQIIKHLGAGETATIRFEYNSIIEGLQIDIKPDSTTNPINPRSRGKIPVAILSSSSFNAPSEIDQESLTFGRTGDEDSLHYRGNGQPNCGGEDVNDDGFVDLVCHFFTQIAAFQSGDTKGILKGLLTNGTAFEAMDTITTVGQGHDSDNDGVEDDIENEAPNNGDGNNDGIADDQQLGVTSLPSALTGEYVTLAVSPGCIATEVQSSDPATLGVPDSEFSYPQGILGFVLTPESADSCTSADVTVIYHGMRDLGEALYRKFGARPGSPQISWYSFPATAGTMMVDGVQVATMSYQLTDGGDGDDDLTANGEIRDPGGAALPQGPATPDIPTLSGKSLALLVSLLSLAAFMILARRRRQML